MSAPHTLRIHNPDATPAAADPGPLDPHLDAEYEAFAEEQNRITEQRLLEEEAAVRDVALIEEFLRKVTSKPA